MVFDVMPKMKSVFVRRSVNELVNVGSMNVGCIVARFASAWCSGGT